MKASLIVEDVFEYVDTEVVICVEVEAVVIIKLDEVMVDILVDLVRVKLNVWSVFVESFGDLEDVKDDVSENFDTEVNIGVKFKAVVIDEVEKVMSDLMVYSVEDGNPVVLLIRRW